MQHRLGLTGFGLTCNDWNQIRLGSGFETKLGIRFGIKLEIRAGIRLGIGFRLDPCNLRFIRAHYGYI